MSNQSHHFGHNPVNDLDWVITGNHNDQVVAKVPNEDTDSVKSLLEGTGVSYDVVALMGTFLTPGGTHELIQCPYDALTSQFPGSDPRYPLDIPKDFDLGNG